MQTYNQYDLSCESEFKPTNNDVDVRVWQLQQQSNAVNADLWQFKALAFAICMY